jgi:hypothetical protein
MGLKIMPVRKAIEALAEAGLVYTVNGRGTFVCQPGMRRGMVAVVAHDRGELPHRGERLEWFINAGIYQGICAALREKKREHELFYLNEHSANSGTWRRRLRTSNCRGCIVLGRLPDGELRDLRAAMGAHRIVSADFSDFPGVGNEIGVSARYGRRVTIADNEFSGPGQLAIDMGPGCDRSVISRNRIGNRVMRVIVNLFSLGMDARRAPEASLSATGAEIRRAGVHWYMVEAQEGVDAS